MIRINLLDGGSHAQAEAAAPAAPATAGTPKSALYLLLAAALLIAGHYLYLQHQKSSLQQQLLAQQAEAIRLSGVKQQFQALMAQQQSLASRIAIIRQLEARRSGPYRFLLRLSSSVAASRRLWLTGCTQKGDTVTLTGRALSLDTLASFIAGMRAHGFQRIRLHQAQQLNSAAHVLEFHFQLMAQSRSAAPPRS